jgi:CRP-like cAMP-binding protein
MSNLIPTLPDLGWLSAAKEEHRETFSAYGEYFTVDAGAVLMKDGELATPELFILVNGQLEVRVPQADGSYLTTALFEPGDMVGELNTFDPGSINPALVQATVTTLLWRLTADRFHQFILDNPGGGNFLLIALIRMLCQRIRRK